ncbi:hypothetical protein OIV83_001001 [Microbotryomycetes sp. JL201]|nr:hypothetical protein OIV83_001001 [Microbotryomycetes sp. JL201]
MDRDHGWPPGDRKRGGPQNPTHSQPFMDEINTLMRHPTLYDPVIKPRLPIVLCHGLYGFDVRGPAFFRLHYWGDLLKILRGKIGAEVFVTSVPGQGGLDSRYLLTKIRPETYRPQSLTTLSTPHRGSEFMAWCRANIGIGTDYEATTEAAARALHRDESIPLPFSLKTPILTRAQVEEAQKLAKVSEMARKEAQKLKASINIPGLSYSFSASVATYLLDLLDSPAYANLTPTFLNTVFNPATPNRDDVKYYSVAARTDRIPVWHPLWLPKQVLDGSEAAREAKGKGAPARWKGNDGLVTIESAQWGEFLGVVDNCDHWNMRGSSGLVSAAASAQAIQEVTGLGRSEDAGAKASNGWQWQDLYALIGSKKKTVKEGVQQGKSSTASAKEASSGPTTPSPTTSSSASTFSREENKGLATVANWVINHLPGVSSPAQPAAPVPKAEKRLHQRIKDDTQPQTTSVADSSAAKIPPPDKPSAAGLPKNVVDTARMLYGSGPSRSSSNSSSISSSQSSPAIKTEKFSLERMTLGLCRKLHTSNLQPFFGFIHLQCQQALRIKFSLALGRMCVIYWSSSDRYQLIVAANRDEFLARPTTRAQFHDFRAPSEFSQDLLYEPTDDQRTLSGLDLMAGGTWLGLSFGRRTDHDLTKTKARLRFATLTNVTETIDQSIKRPSRGELVKTFLQDDQGDVRSFLEEVEQQKQAFSGFNLVVGQMSGTGQIDMGYVSNREEQGKRARQIPVPDRGQARGVSNATLESTANEPLWPKVVIGSNMIKQAVAQATQSHASEKDFVDELWSVLRQVTANPAPIRDRTHLRHTILVRPLMMDSHAPLPDEASAFETEPPAVDELGRDYERPESDDNRWYATRVQTILLVEWPGTDGAVRVVFREREAYTLVDGKPRWSGDERVFELSV